MVLADKSIEAYVIFNFFLFFRAGLDPASRFFNENPQLALQESDAKNVTVFHTNTGRYGMEKEFGSNDTFVNGGKTQPECKRKLTTNICSHNRAWEVYSEHLQKIKLNPKKIGRLRSDRFVLCLDVSRSMDDYNRLMRAISAAIKLLKVINVGSYIGIVSFSEQAETSHRIIEIKDEADRESLISKLPKETIGGTSIGAGLNLSINMLQNLPESDQFCSTIILLSDGEQNVDPTPEDVLPELQKACIGVNSVALGAQAFGDLEVISSNGNVIYAMENDTAQQIADTDRAFAFSYENEIDADIRPIYLPTQRVTLSNDENVIPVVIDENIGKDTELTFTGGDKQNVYVKLISPKGQIYSSSSPEYIDSSMQKTYKIPLAEPGKWDLVVNKVSKRRRSIRSISDAIITVKSHQLDDKVPAIRLDASLSKRTLEYPKSNKRSDIDEARIIIFAELRRDQYPIIHAKILGHIQGVKQKTISFRLRDDGAYPDELANDGVYTASISKLDQPQRYSVFVTASNANRTAKLVPKEIDYFERELIDCDHIECETMSYFEREAYVGSIKLISTDNQERIPPNPITDLRATVRNATERLIALEWTSPVDEVFDMNVKQYDIRALIDGQEFENAFRFNDNHFVAEPLDDNNSNTERLEKYLLRIPNHIWKYDKKKSEPGFYLELTFALKAIGMNDEASPVSNSAMVVIKERPLVLINVHRVCKTIRRKIQRVGWINITYC